MITDLTINKFVNSIDEFVHKDSSSNSVIPLHEPDFKNTNSLSYIKDCIDSAWVSSGGNWVSDFESKLCEYTKSKYAIAVCNGTIALRLALHIVGVKAGDEVLVTPISFVATVNAISHLGATPHFVDIENKTLAICPNKLEKRLEEIAFVKDGETFNKISKKRIKAILPVHVFGTPFNFEFLEKIANKWKIPIIEDAAEALGSWYTNKNGTRHCGSLGEIGILSFNGNKIITTGGGGALLTNNEKYARQAKHISTTAKIPHPWEFFHDQIGWNDRMPNINAALGYAQLEKINQILKIKKNIYEHYCQILSDFSFVELLKSPHNSITNNWLVTIRLLIADDEEAMSVRNKILEIAHKKNIFLRPVWKALNSLPMYSQMQKADLKEAQYQEIRLINLPSSPKLMS